MSARLDTSGRPGAHRRLQLTLTPTLTHPAHLPHPNCIQLCGIPTLEPAAEDPQQAKSGLKVMGRNGRAGAGGNVRGRDFLKWIMILHHYFQMWDHRAECGVAVRPSVPGRMPGGPWEVVKSLFLHAAHTPLGILTRAPPRSRRPPGLQLQRFCSTPDSCSGSCIPVDQKKSNLIIRKLPVVWCACLGEQAPARGRRENSRPLQSGAHCSGLLLCA